MKTVDDIFIFFKTNLESFVKNYELPHINYVSSLDHPVKLDDTNYMASEIRDRIHTLRSVAIIRNKTIIYYNPTRHPKYMIEFIVFYTDFLNYVFSTHLSQRPGYFDVDITVLLTAQKKRLPSSSKTALSALHVNSGVTTHILGTSKKYVVVYREEEVFKVLMHELIHAYELDMTRMRDDMDLPIRAYFHLNTPMRINESLTDTLACVYNAVMYALLSGSKSPHKVLDIERRYILTKARDIINFLGYTIHPVKGIIKPPKDTPCIREHTHVTAYYILKALNWFYLPDFLNRYVPWDESGYTSIILDNLSHPDFWGFVMQSKKLSNRSTRMSKIDINSVLYCKKSKLLKTLLSQ